MVLPVGGFFPIPLAMMIPFMATQSLVMGEAFGKAFQFGKRKISAMSNEEFNKLDIETVASQMFASYKNIEGNLKESINQSTEFQQFIFAQLILLGPELVKALGGAALTDIAEKVAPVPDITPEGVRVRQPSIIPKKVDKSQDFLPPPKKPKRFSRVHFAGKPKKITALQKLIRDRNSLKSQMLQLNRGAQGGRGSSRANLMKLVTQIKILQRRIKAMDIMIAKLQR